MEEAEHHDDEAHGPPMLWTNFSLCKVGISGENEEGYNGHATKVVSDGCLFGEAWLRAAPSRVPGKSADGGIVRDS